MRSLRNARTRNVDGRQNSRSKTSPSKPPVSPTPVSTAVLPYPSSSRRPVRVDRFPGRRVCRCSGRIRTSEPIPTVERRHAGEEWMEPFSPYPGTVSLPTYRVLSAEFPVGRQPAVRLPTIPLRGTPIERGGCDEKSTTPCRRHNEGRTGGAGGRDVRGQAETYLLAQDAGGSRVRIFSGTSSRKPAVRSTELRHISMSYSCVNK
jgi:hypothetical protein